MTDAGCRELRSPAAVELRVSAELENLAVLRTLVGAVGTFSDLDFDAVADLRLAVDEACTRLIRSAVPDSVLVVVVDPRDDVVVVDVSVDVSLDADEDGNGAAATDVVSPGSFSWHVLSSLTDQVQTSHNGHRAGITLTTRRAGTER
jgi:anti-sigma regulatory factor (Ser/Thr protein kinase)